MLMFDAPLTAAQLRRMDPFSGVADNVVVPAGEEQDALVTVNWSTRETPSPSGFGANMLMVFVPAFKLVCRTEFSNTPKLPVMGMRILAVTTPGPHPAKESLV